MTHTICSIFRKEEDTKEHVLDCEVELEKGKHTIGSSNINHWKQILLLKIFRDNKNKKKAQMQIVLGRKDSSNNTKE